MKIQNSDTAYNPEHVGCFNGRHAPVALPQSQVNADDEDEADADDESGTDES